MSCENKKQTNERFLYYLYLGLWGNLDYKTQNERLPMTYREFSSLPDKVGLIDLVKTMIYNRRE